MTSGQAVQAAGDIESRIVPSVDTIRATYDALRKASEQVAAGSKSILDTCELVCRALSIFSSEGASSGGGFALPAAMKVFSATLGKYVQQKTGVSLDDWTEFANDARRKFEQYLAQLAKVAALSERYDAAGASAAISAEQLREDEALLEDTRFKTRLWRPVLARLPELSRLIDSILESRKAQAAAAPAEEKRSIGGFLQKAAEQVKERISDEQDDLMKGLLSPVHDARERLHQLKTQVDQLSGSLDELDDLLDLEIAQIRAHAGKIPARQVELLSQRIAFTIVIPRLQDQLEQARKTAADHQGYLQKLGVARQQGKVSVKVHDGLAAEYQAGLDAARSREQALAAELQLWKSRGGTILEAAKQWLQEEIETVTARDLAGQMEGEAARERTAALRRELGRSERSARLLAAP